MAAYDLFSFIFCHIFILAIATFLVCIIFIRIVLFKGHYLLLFWWHRLKITFLYFIFNIYWIFSYQIVIIIHTMIAFFILRKWLFILKTCEASIYVFWLLWFSIFTIQKYDVWIQLKTKCWNRFIYITWTFQIRWSWRLSALYRLRLIIFWYWASLVLILISCAATWSWWISHYLVKFF